MKIKRERMLESRKRQLEFLGDRMRKKGLETLILIETWRKHVTNGEDLEKMETKFKRMLQTRKRRLEFLGHIMRKGFLENLILKGEIEGKRDNGKQCITHLAS